MEWYFSEWAHYVVRWTHLITGIAWIGSSFYFMWLDAALEKPKAQTKPDVEGELWMVHSGGFYEVERKRITPATMPAKLHWFKYEALFTWISGICLLVLAYYLNASAMMIDSGKTQLTAEQSIYLSVGTLIITWFLYDGLWQSTIGKKLPGLALAISLSIVASAAFLFAHYFSGRAAAIHLGAMMGTWMVANVWVRILPAQSKMVDATREGRTPDYALSGHAKKRSVHNTYMTFPVLFMMLSNHFPHTFGNSMNAVILLLMIVFGAGVRHVMVAKDRSRYWILVPTAASALALVFTAATQKESDGAGTSKIDRNQVVKFSVIQDIVQRRCVTCHADKPAISTFGPSPGGVKLDLTQGLAERLKSLTDKIQLRVIQTRTMPPANISHLQDDERELIGLWLSQGAKPE
ncbi:MAG: urate hydroxylase PuuD [Bdellovibrionales bacterium]|nr:urate hydroxylase PuuD [Bdellovibrionales bacterium]